MPTTKKDDAATTEEETPEVETRGGAAVPPSAVPPGEEVATTTEGEEVAEPYLDPYKQVLHPLELPANPVAAAQYPNPEIVDPAVPISEERAAQGEAAITAEEEKWAALLPPEHPAHAPEVDPEGEPAALPAGPAATGAHDQEQQGTQAVAEQEATGQEQGTQAAKEQDVAGQPDQGSSSKSSKADDKSTTDKTDQTDQPIEVEGTVEGTVSGTVSAKDQDKGKK